jgi:hypothetical protein
VKDTRADHDTRIPEPKFPHAPSRARYHCVHRGFRGQKPTSPSQLRSDGSLMGICDRLLASTDGATRRFEPSLHDEHTVRCFVAGRSGRAIASASQSRPDESFIAFTTSLLHGPQRRDAYLPSGLSILKFSCTPGSGSAPRYRPAKITSFW